MPKVPDLATAGLPTVEASVTPTAENSTTGAARWTLSAATLNLKSPIWSVDMLAGKDIQQTIVFEFQAAQALLWHVAMAPLGDTPPTWTKGVSATKAAAATKVEGYRHEASSVKGGELTIAPPGPTILRLSVGWHKGYRIGRVMVNGQVLVAALPLDVTAVLVPQIHVSGSGQFDLIRYEREENGLV